MNSLLAVCKYGSEQGRSRGGRQSFNVTPRGRGKKKRREIAVGDKGFTQGGKLHGSANCYKKTMAKEREGVAKSVLS